MNHSELSDQLISLAKKDQEMRKQFQDGQILWNKSIDTQNTAEFKKIIEVFGWPEISKVGEEAAKSAWLLAQHSPDIEIQQKCLELMKNLPEGEVDKRYIAYLEDKILVFQEKEQIYGTQFRKDERGTFQPLPIIDKEKVNERRKRVGLDSIEEYSSKFNQ